MQTLVKTITFMGHEIEYDATCPKRWSWQKAANSNDPSRVMNAISLLLLGREDEYAELFDDSFDTMQELVRAVIEDRGTTAKN